MSSSSYEAMRAKKRERKAERDARAANRMDRAEDTLQEAYENRIIAGSAGGTSLARKKERERLISRLYEFFDVRDLTFSEKNDYHITDEDIQGLATSILESGITVPIVVRGTDEGFEVVDGERRSRAHLYLGEHVAEKHYMIPALYFKEGEYSEEDIDFARDMLNVGQRALTNYERARAVQRHEERLIASRAQNPERYKGRKTREILAEEFGVSARTITTELSIARNLIPEAAEMYDDEELSKQDAAKLASMDPEEQKNAIAAVKSEKSTTTTKARVIKHDRNSYMKKASNALKRASKSEGPVDRMLAAQLQTQLDGLSEGEIDANTAMLSAYIKLKQAIEAGADDENLLNSIAKLTKRSK